MNNPEDYGQGVLVLTTIWLLPVSSVIALKIKDKLSGGVCVCAALTDVFIKKHPIIPRQ